MTAKNKLRANWSKGENDLILWHPLGIRTGSDARILSDALSPLIDELERRGYDKTTIKFSIEPKLPNYEKFKTLSDDQ